MVLLALIEVVCGLVMKYCPMKGFIRIIKSKITLVVGDNCCE